MYYQLHANSTSFSDKRFHRSMHVLFHANNDTFSQVSIKPCSLEIKIHKILKINAMVSFNSVFINRKCNLEIEFI